MTKDIKGQRRWAIIVFSIVANIYLAAFALDSLLSVADETLRLFGSGNWEWLKYTRNTVAYAVVYASAAMIYLFLFVPQLPRLPFILPILFALWAAFGAPGTPISMLGRYAGLGISSFQALLTLLAVLILHKNQGFLYVAARTLPIKRHLVLRTAAAVVTAIIATPIVVAFAFGCLEITCIERMSDNYIHFGWSELQTKETVLTNGKQKVYLLATMHFGEERFYESMRSDMAENSLVLAEGVTDETQKLSTKLSYGGVAQALGLSPQGPIDDWIKDDADQAIEPAAGKAEENSKAAKLPKAHIEIERADVDIASFKDSTITYLNLLTKLYASQTKSEILDNWKALAATDRETVKSVFGDILTARNAHLMTVFDNRASKFESIVIPWGAMHMPGIKAALIERGYTVEIETTRPVIHYEMLFAQL